MMWLMQMRSLPICAVCPGQRPFMILVLFCRAQHSTRPVVDRGAEIERIRFNAMHYIHDEIAVDDTRYVLYLHLCGYVTVCEHVEHRTRIGAIPVCVANISIY
mmetsp:Transcript_43275/g.46973  ORF Transcript_43275/g.46973 Transcript_43275/m.46973 type:complete len:103 (-) Transcript_43275:138-446(-)